MKDPDFVIPANLPIPNDSGSLSAAAALGRQIGASDQKTAMHFLETAHLCEMGFERYRTRGLSVLLRAANMSKSKFMKYVAIAHDVRLRRIELLLPPSLSTIHQIAQLNDEEFDEAIKAEIIRPNVRRSEIESLRKTAANKGRTTTPPADSPAVLREIAAGSRCELIVPDDFGPDDCARIRQLLQRLRTKFGVEIVAIKEAEQQKEP